MPLLHLSVPLPGMNDEILTTSRAVVNFENVADRSRYKCRKLSRKESVTGNEEHVSFTGFKFDLG